MDQSRRHFVSSAVSTALLAGIQSLGHAGSAQESNRVLKIGLIGCGARGTYVAQHALLADANTKLWAVGDVFGTQIDRCLQQLATTCACELPDQRKFSGWDAYQKVIHSGVDLVILATPPRYRPLYLRAAVEAGKHVFAETPMAVDVSGVKSILVSSRIAAAKGTTIQHGFCWRYAPKIRAGISKVLAGDLGKVLAFYASNITASPASSTRVNRRSSLVSDHEWNMRHWREDQRLSGGPLLEQAIHTIDKMSWVMGGIAPIAARGGGGSLLRTAEGTLWDHYEVTYEYPGDITCHIAHRQFPHSTPEMIDHVICEKGTLIAPERVNILDQNGEMNWSYSESTKPGTDMHQICHREWFTAIRNRIPLNKGDFMVQSTLLGILGREAAHSGKRIKWQEICAMAQIHS